MSLKRKELDKVYEGVISKYKRKERDKDIKEGIDILYKALIDYIDGKDIYQ